MNGSLALGMAVVLCSQPGALKGLELAQVVLRREVQPDGSVRQTRQPVTVFLAGDRARLEEASGDVTIVRLDRGEVLQLDTLLKSYRRKTFKELRTQWRTLNALLLEQIEGTPLGHPRRAELVDQLADGPDKWREIWKLPPGEHRSRLVERYKLPPEPPVVEIRSTGETKIIAGRTAVRHVAVENGEPRDWAYLATDLAFDRRYYEFLELWGWLAPELASKLSRLRGAGLPLATMMRSRAGGELEVVTEKLQERELDAGLFEVPEGFVEQKPRPAFR